MCQHFDNEVCWTTEAFEWRSSTAVYQTKALEMVILTRLQGLQLVILTRLQGLQLVILTRLQVLDCLRLLIGLSTYL